MSSLPAQMPRTQSAFYMPLITHAYFIVKGLVIQKFISESTGFVQQLKELNNNRYMAFLNAVINLLKSDGKLLAKLDEAYKKDSYPTNSVGHIPGDFQEEILEKSNITTQEYNNHFLNIKMPWETTNVRELFEYIIQTHYYPYYGKYLKYKAKYLNLKKNI